MNTIINSANIRQLNKFDVNKWFNHLNLLSESEDDKIQKVKFNSYLEIAASLNCPTNCINSTKSFTYKSTRFDTKLEDGSNRMGELPEEIKSTRISANISLKNLEPNFIDSSRKFHQRTVPNQLKTKTIDRVKNLRTERSSFDLSGVRLGKKRDSSWGDNQQSIDSALHKIADNNAELMLRSNSKPKFRDPPDNRKKKVHLFPYEVTHHEHFPKIDFAPLQNKIKKNYFQNGKLFEAAK